MPKRPAIRFTVDPEKKIEVEHYARIKGFDNPSNLARMALFVYMRKNPLKGIEVNIRPVGDTGAGAKKDL